LLTFFTAVQSNDRADEQMALQLYRDARRSLTEAVSLGYESADVYFDAARLDALIASATGASEAATLRDVNQSLSRAYLLGLDPKRVEELRPIWPELTALLDRPAGIVASQESRPPVVDPFWTAETVTVTQTGR
jgi:hypothetical protein